MTLPAAAVFVSRWLVGGRPTYIQSLPASDENAGATTLTEGVSYPKRRSVRMLYEMPEEEALGRAITFLEDALGYRLVGEGGGRSLGRCVVCVLGPLQASRGVHPRPRERIFFCRYFFQAK